MTNSNKIESIAEKTNRLIEINDLILQAEEAGRKDGLDPYLHQDFNIIRAKGTKHNREEFLGDVSANAGLGRSQESPEIKLYGDCAVVAVRVTTLRKPDGAVATRRFWNTRVFLRDGVDWRCVAWQVTEMLLS